MRDDTIKEKSGNHKATNTFRFQSFAERIRSVKINSRKLALSRESEEDGIQSELSQVITKWQDLNLSEGFKSFLASLGGNISTVMQVVQKESHIAETLIEHLQNTEAIALPPILSCLVGFATDTYQIFYAKYFFKFIPIVTQYGQTKNHQSVEEVFVCLASLFVLLHTEIKDDIYSLLFKHKYFDYFSKKHVWYINELAAQSLSSVVRNLPDKADFYKNCFKKLEESPNHTDGFARLICNCFKLDVGTRLHFSTKGQLLVIFEVLRDNPSSQSVAALCSAFKTMAKHVSTSKKSNKTPWQVTWKEDSQYVWPVFYKYIEDAITQANVNEKFVESLCKIYMCLLEQHNAALLLDVSEFVSLSKKVFKISLSENVSKQYLNMIKQIFEHKNVTGDQLGNLMSMVFESDISPKIILQLVEHIAKLGNFDMGKELQVLEYFQNLCEQDDAEVIEDLISTAASIVMSRCTPLRCANDSDSWNRQFLDFSLVLCKKDSVPKKTMTTVLKRQIGTLQKDLSNVDAVILSCICIGHLPIDHSKTCVGPLANLIGTCLKWFMKSNDKHGTSIGDVDHTEMYFFLLGILSETLFHMVSPKKLCEKLSHLDKLLNLPKASTNVHFLKAFDLYVTSLHKSNPSKLTVEYFEMLYKCLSPTLAANHPIARMITAHIFSLFKLPLLNENESELTLFDIFLKADETQVGPFTFKERLRLLGLIDADHISNLKTTLPSLETAPIQFLIGQFRINFKDLWAGVMTNIAGHARALPIDVFWPFWHSVLKSAATEALEELCGQRQTEITFESENVPLKTLYTVLMSHDSFGNLTSRQSALEFRDHLWACMLQFPEVCERRSRDMVTLFDNYIHTELFPNDEYLAKSQDVSSPSKDETSDDDSDMDDEETEKTIRKTQKAPIQSLFSHVNVFSKFKNPRSMYKSKELEEIYLQFLSHPYSKAQKVALDALMSYNYKYLKPYKEFLYNLLDDRIMKDELTLFSFDGTGVESRHSLKSEHRSGLMPIVLRVLYGRKQAKNDGNKGNARIRKAIILKFLGRCNAEELAFFQHLAFGVFDTMVEGDVLAMVKRALSETNPRNILPPKRMQGAFHSIEEFMESIGNLLTNEEYSGLMKILFFLMATSSAVLSKKDSISPGYATILQKIRKATTKRTISFFASSASYPWSKAELDALFLVFVGPSVRKVQYDSARHVPPVLKLMEQWAENHRYHILFAREVGNNTTCFDYLLKVLQQDNCVQSVIKLVMKIIEGLLSPTPNSSSIQVVAAKLDVQPLWTIKKSDTMNIGQQIVCHFKNNLLAGFRKSFSDRTFGLSELSILEKIAPWITESSGAQDLTTMILNLLSTGSIKDEKKQKYMLAITRDLVHVLESPENHVKTVSSLFGSMDCPASRTLLCEVMSKIAAEKVHYSKLASWCRGLNIRSLDQFDVEPITLQLIEIKDFLQTADHFMPEECLCLVHNLFWMVENIESDHLMDIIISTLKIVLETSSKFYDENPHAGTLIVDSTVTHIRNLLKNQKSSMGACVMKILSNTASVCHKISPRLGELSLLASPEDPEHDVFVVMGDSEAKALQLLAEKLLDTSLHFSKNTITQFLIPICGRYLFNPDYLSQESVINNSVKCIAALAKRLPWTNYRTLLKYYISQLQKTFKFQRIGIKLLEALLDSFHEDITEEAVDNESEETEDKCKSIYKDLAEDLIPKLKATMMETTDQEKYHKSNRSKSPEEQHIKRMPLALAIVKLLQKLPKDLLDNNVPGILLNLLSYLKSKNDNVREQSRHILVKIMMTLGSEYLPALIKDLVGLMTKGFHHHVMVMTLHCVLHEMKSIIHPQHLDDALEDILKICISDSLGTQSEEKTATSMSRTYSEARTQKSFDIMNILGSVIQTSHLQVIVTEIDDALETQSKKTVNKIATHLHRFASGLEGNDHIDLKTKAVFIQKTLSSKLEQIEQSKHQNDTSEDDERKMYQRPDCFLIEPEPCRSKPVAQVVESVSSHTLVYFSLDLLHHLIRHKKFSSKDKLHRQLLDGFIPLLSQCLVSEHPKVCTVTLTVIPFLLEFDLPSFNKEFSNLYCKMFVILEKFGSFTRAKGENYKMIQLIFKTLALFINKVEQHHFKDEHIKVLIEYTKINLPESSQYHSTFPILKALIKKKFNYEALHSMMDSVKEMSITTEIPIMRDQARSTYLSYLLNYPKRQKQLLSSWNYFLSNLEYDELEGRKSALLMVQSLIEKFPRDLFNKKRELICFTQLSKCILKYSQLRDLYKDAIQALYENSRLKEAYINQAIFWMRDNKNGNFQNAFTRHLAAQSLIPCLRSSTTHPPMVFKTLLPKLVACLDSKNFTRDEDMSDDEFLKLQVSLNSLLEVLICLLERLKEKGEYGKMAKSHLWEHIVGYLGFPNIGTRLYSVILINTLFIHHSAVEEIPIVLSTPAKTRILAQTLPQILWTTSKGIPDEDLNRLVDNAIKALLYIVKIAEKITIDTPGEDEEQMSRSRMAYFVMHEVGEEAYKEMKNAVHSISCRIGFLKLIAGICLTFGKELGSLKSVCRFMVSHITRELSDPGLPPALKKLTDETLLLVKNQMGPDSFAVEFNECKRLLDSKKEARKRRLKETLDSNPQAAAKKKQKLQEVKKQKKKRKQLENATFSAKRIKL